MNHPPLPPRLTLDEAAQAISERLGRQWTVKHVLGCASRGEISVFARLPIDACMVRCEPVDGEPDEMVWPAGALCRITSGTAAALLSAPSVEYCEYTKLAKLPGWLVGDGEAIYGPQVEWRIAEGETPPAITMAECIVSDAGVQQLLEEYAESEQADTEAAPAKLPVEQPQARRRRLLDCLETETKASGERGALERVTAREKALRPTADRSNIGRDIKRAREERTEERRAGLFPGPGRVTQA